MLRLRAEPCLVLPQGTIVDGAPPLMESIGLPKPLYVMNVMHTSRTLRLTSSCAVFSVILFNPRRVVRGEGSSPSIATLVSSSTLWSMKHWILRIGSSEAKSAHFNPRMAE